MSAEKWFEYLEKVHETTRHLNPGPTSRERVRVAILDTGVYFEHPKFKKATSLSVLQKDRCRGFPSQLNAIACLDKNGHGTHCASVLLRTAPNIDLYVARVFDDAGKVVPEDNFEGIVDVRSRYSAL